MSMPKFPQSEDILSREEALNAILTSIAAEEIALGHILNAESEKIIYAIEEMKKNERGDTQKLLEINESAASLIDRVNDMQIILKNKMRLAVSFMPKNRPCPPEPSCPPQKPPCPPEPPCPPQKPPEPPCSPVYNPCREPKPCDSVFSALTKYSWTGGNAPALEEVSCCGDGVKLLTSSRCEPAVLLPGGVRYRLSLDFELVKGAKVPVCIEAALYNGGVVIRSEKYIFDGTDSYLYLNDTLTWETPKRRENKFTLRLLSEAGLKIRKGTVSVKKIQEAGSLR